MQFYQVKFKWEASTDDGKLKTISEVHLIQATSCRQAEEITQRLYKETSPGFEVVQVKASNIKGVFKRKQEEQK